MCVCVCEYVCVCVCVRACVSSSLFSCSNILHRTTPTHRRGIQVFKEEEDEEQLIEAQRRQREELMAKLK